MISIFPSNPFSGCTIFPVFTVLVDFFVDFVFDFDDDVGKFFILFTVGVDVVIHETADDGFGTCVWKSIVGDGFCFPDGSFDDGFQWWSGDCRCNG